MARADVVDKSRRGRRFRHERTALIARGAAPSSPAAVAQLSAQKCVAGIHWTCGEEGQLIAPSRTATSGAIDRASRTLQRV